MKTTVWTKQHISVLHTLGEQGRYVAKREYIVRDLQEHAGLVLEVYDWYVAKAAARHPKPPDAAYPVWVSFSRDATMLPGQGTVVLELEVDERLIMPVSINKWGAILNYSYIAADPEDERRHSALLAAHGVSDAKAFMGRFYPQIKREIIASWDRLFDDAVVINNTMAYGTLWELREEWIVKTIP